MSCRIELNEAMISHVFELLVFNDRARAVITTVLAYSQEALKL